MIPLFSAFKSSVRPFLKWGLFLGIMGIFSLLSSCAQTVTEKDLSDLRLIVSITFEGTPNSNYSTYILFSKTPNTINFNSGLSSFYFTAPGQNYDLTKVNQYTENAVGGISEYYDEYFSTWEHYILITANQAYLYSPKTGEDTFLIDTDNDHLTFTYNTDFRTDTNILSDKTYSFTINSTRLNLVENDTLYFRFVVVKNEDGYPSGPIENVLESEGNIRIDDQQTADDDSNSSQFSSTSSSSTLKSWSITVQ